VLKALQTASEELHGKFGLRKPADDPADDDRERRPRMQRADALALIAESFLQHGSEAMTSGDRRQIVIHVDAETLRDDVAGDVRSMELLNIGRKTRIIPTGLRRALNARDRGCRFPGCPHERFTMTARCASRIGTAWRSTAQHRCTATGGNCRFSMLERVFT
jgi:hypothetical protein